MQNYQDSQDQTALIDYANSIGVQIDARSNISTIKSKIANKLGVKKANKKDAVMSKDRVMKIIMIHKTEGSTGTDDVQVSVNGRVFIIKRGVEAVVPDFVVEALNNAVKTEYVFVGEDKDLEAREVNAYPFSVLGDG